MENEGSDDQKVNRTAREAAEREWNLQRAENERLEIVKSKRLFAESEEYATKQRNLAKGKSAADRSFAEAAEFAKNQIKSDGLEGEIKPYYEVHYTIAQGLKAAIHGREDVAATFILQRDILVRLDAIKSLLWVAVGLLAFVAYKLL